VQLLAVDLQENYSDLNALLKTINDDLCTLRTLQNEMGQRHETEVFSLTINLDDYEQLQKIYTFVDNITMLDIKRFGIVYKLRNTLMDETFRKALGNHDSIPPALSRMINRKVYKSYQDSKNIPVDLKIEILRNIPDILEAECRLLIYTLEFTAHQAIRTKSIYRTLLQILERSRKARGEQVQEIKRIWNIYLAKMKQYRPANYQQNYQNNKKRLLEDAGKALGGRF